MEGLSDEGLKQVAAYFQALSEPTRLQIVNLLRKCERNVGELAQLCGYTPANISRHLSMLTKLGLVVRESRGTSAYYRIADKSIFKLCDLVCDSIARKLDRLVLDREIFALGAVKQRNASSRTGKTKL